MPGHHIRMHDQTRLRTDTLTSFSALVLSIVVLKLAHYCSQKSLRRDNAGTEVHDVVDSDRVVPLSAGLTCAKLAHKVNTRPIRVLHLEQLPLESYER